MVRGVELRIQARNAAIAAAPQIGRLFRLRPARMLKKPETAHR
jgi:hypothetical protein